MKEIIQTAELGKSKGGSFKDFAPVEKSTDVDGAESVSTPHKITKHDPKPAFTHSLSEGNMYEGIK